MELEELENDLPSVDMGHAAEGLIDALRMRIVGSRITTKTPWRQSSRRPSETPSAGSSRQATGTSTGQ